MSAKVIGSVYTYDNGRARIEFCWDGQARDGYAWSVKRQRRLASFRTRREVQAAFDLSNNSEGAYGCARLSLGED